jgi:hypothetical protein
LVDVPIDYYFTESNRGAEREGKSRNAGYCAVVVDAIGLLKRIRKREKEKGKEGERKGKRKRERLDFYSNESNENHSSSPFECGFAIVCFCISTC